MRRITISTKRKLFIGVFTVLAALSIFGGVTYGQAGFSCTSTVIWGRKDCVNYATGRPKDGEIPPFHNNFLVNGSYTKSFNQKTFTDEVNKRLFKGDKQDTVSATVLVNIMLGKPGPSFGGNMASATASARANFDQWVQLVKDYDAAGQVNWDYIYATPQPYENSAYDNFENDVYHFKIDKEKIWVMRFHITTGGGRDFFIQYFCGNPIGEANLPPIKPVSPTPPTPPTPPPGPSPAPQPATGNVNPPTPPSNGNPSGTDIGDPSVNSSCQVISGHAFDPKVPAYAVKVTATFSTGGPPVTTTAGTTGAHLFQINTPDSVRNSLSAVTVTVKGTDATGTDYALAPSITIGPCHTVVAGCVNATASPSAPDPNARYSIKATIQYGTSDDAIIAASQPDFKFYAHITGPNGPAIVYDNKDIKPVSRSGNQLSVKVDNLPPLGKTGTYQISWGATGTYGAVQCGYDSPGRAKAAAVTALNKPYFNVLGADVRVGSQMSPGTGAKCSIIRNDQASIVGWSVDPINDNYGGAGTQYAGIALNHIQEFATARGHTTAPTEPSGLAFANNIPAPPGMINAPAGLYGGKFDGADCVASYWAGANNSNRTPGPAVLSNLNFPQAFPAGGNIPNGAQMIYYIEGDLLIDSDVKFSGVYGNVNEVPKFAVIVKGNIFISPTVKRLDGFYIAQASTAASTDGIIFSCAPSGFATSTANVLNKDLQASCNTPLEVNGAFLSRQIWLLRTAGGLSTTPAETFNYVPEVWLRGPFGGTSLYNYNDYDAISSLPPVL